jgi:two-component system, chemotaxis family, sensor histidine kinase and response regulator PixL
MPQDSEQEVRLQFLEEAKEHLSTIESGIMGLGTQGVKRETFDGILRAAHSIKGGAAMMGFDTLSHVAHRMEDFFKVLKVGRTETDNELEQDLLTSIDRLHQVIALHRQGRPIDEAWLASNVAPILDQLHDRLGDPRPEDEASLLAEDEGGEDMAVMLFESEVGGILERLEALLAQDAPDCLVEEFDIAAQELGGLAEMLDMPSFAQLCQSVTDQLQAAEDSVQGDIARLALQEWKRSQAMVLIGQKVAIPSALDLSSLDIAAIATELEEINAPVSAAVHDFDPADLETVATESLFSTPEPTESLFSAPEPAESLFSMTEPAEVAAVEANLADAWAEDDLDLFFELETGSDLVTAAVSEEILEDNTAFEDLLEQENSVSIEPAQQEIPVPSARSREIPQALEAPEAPSPERTIRVPVSQLNQLSELFGELIIERNGLKLQLQKIRSLMDLMGQRVQSLDQANFKLRATYDQASTSAIPKLVASVTSGGHANLMPTVTSLEDFDLLEMDHYSGLHLLSQELMETAVQIREVTSDINTNLNEADQTARALTVTSKELQTNVTQVRMRPLSDILGRFPRMLRDLSLQHGKAVKLEVIGGSTLVDRSILEALNDPLMHLIRNSFDHGIEDPETRKAQGKSPQGVIKVQATYRGNQTIITISDNGAGINLDKVRARAMQLGIDQETLNAASKSDLLDLIFEPGFSTAGQVTDLSGRGVGMDVVRTNLKDIRGSVTVSTEAGLGTTFTLAVPYTLSVVRVLLVESANMLLAFPTDSVEEITLLDKDQVLAHIDQGALRWNDTVVPMMKLDQWFRFSTPPKRPDTEATPLINAPMVLMLNKGDDLVAMSVDRYWGEQEVTVRQVEGDVSLPTGFAGCTILGDGRIVPLVDAISLLTWIEDQQASSTKLPAWDDLPPVAEPANAAAMIMVVDDSINVRRFLALTLEKAGFRVEQAKDGQHALEKLQAGLPVQAVICDVEMPRLDGFGFLAHVKSKPEFKQIPVVMLTSRSGDKHRNLAMTLGATEYFSKPFREHELLQTLKRLIAV